jgi:hypothetical protein
MRPFAPLLHVLSLVKRKILDTQTSRRKPIVTHAYTPNRPNRITIPSFLPLSPLTSFNPHLTSFLHPSLPPYNSFSRPLLLACPWCCCCSSRKENLFLDLSDQDGAHSPFRPVPFGVGGGRVETETGGRCLEDVEAEEEEEDRSIEVEELSLVVRRVKGKNRLIVEKRRTEKDRRSALDSSQEKKK